LRAERHLPACSSSPQAKRTRRRFFQEHLTRGWNVLCWKWLTAAVHLKHDYRGRVFAGWSARLDIRDAWSLSWPALSTGSAIGTTSFLPNWPLDSSPYFSIGTSHPAALRGRECLPCLHMHRRWSIHQSLSTSPSPHRSYKGLHTPIIGPQEGEVVRKPACCRTERKGGGR
jgi:hypothetical protein